MEERTGIRRLEKSVKYYDGLQITRLEEEKDVFSGSSDKERSLKIR